jgi:hypothetical protein
MAAIYSNGGNRWNILGFNFTKRDALSSVYKISMVATSKKVGTDPTFSRRIFSLSNHIAEICFSREQIRLVQRTGFTCVLFFAQPTNTSVLV